MYRNIIDSYIFQKESKSSIDSVFMAESDAGYIERIRDPVSDKFISVTLHKPEYPLRFLPYITSIKLSDKLKL